MSSLVAVFLIVLQLARRRLGALARGRTALDGHCWLCRCRWCTRNSICTRIFPARWRSRRHSERPDGHGAMCSGYMSGICTSSPRPRTISRSTWHRPSTPDNPELPYELLQPHGYSYLGTHPPGYFHGYPQYLPVRSDRLVLRSAQRDTTSTSWRRRSRRRCPSRCYAWEQTALVSRAGHRGRPCGNPACSRPDLEAVYLLAFGWFSNIVVFLPFVTMPYDRGLLDLAPDRCPACCRSCS